MTVKLQHEIKNWKGHKIGDFKYFVGDISSFNNLSIEIKEVIDDNNLRFLAATHSQSGHTYKETLISISELEDKILHDDP